MGLTKDTTSGLNPFIYRWVFSRNHHILVYFEFYVLEMMHRQVRDHSYERNIYVSWYTSVLRHASASFYWPSKCGASFVDPFCYLCFTFVFIISFCLCLAALWSPARKGLTSWPSCVYCFLCVVVTFPIRCLGSGVSLIPDICLLYFLSCQIDPANWLIRQKQLEHCPIWFNQTNQLPLEGLISSKFLVSWSGSYILVSY